MSKELQIRFVNEKVHEVIDKINEFEEKYLLNDSKKNNNGDNMNNDFNNDANISNINKQTNFNAENNSELSKTNYKSKINNLTERNDHFASTKIENSKREYKNLQASNPRNIEHKKSKDLHYNFINNHNPSSTSMNSNENNSISYSSKTSYRNNLNNYNHQNSINKELSKAGFQNTRNNSNLLINQDNKLLTSVANQINEHKSNKEYNPNNDYINNNYNINKPTNLRTEGNYKIIKDKIKRKSTKAVKSKVPGLHIDPFKNEKQNSLKSSFFEIRRDLNHLFLF